MTNSSKRPIKNPAHRPSEPLEPPGPPLVANNPAIATLGYPKNTQKPVLLIRQEQQYWLVQDTSGYAFWIWERKLKALG